MFNDPAAELNDNVNDNVNNLATGRESEDVFVKR